jgi:hypothetical protein
MNKKLLASLGVVAIMAFTTSCGFLGTSEEEVPVQVEETIEEAPSAETNNNLLNGEEVLTEGVDINEELKVDGKIIYKPSFTKTETGGVKTIILDPGASSEQLKFVQNLLMANSTMQSNGLAIDPVGIYGSDIPGIKIMSDNRDKYETIYKPLPSGGSIEYKASDPEVLKAIHSWIDYSNSTYKEDDYTPPIE